MFLSSCWFIETKKVCRYCVVSSLSHFYYCCYNPTRIYSKWEIKYRRIKFIYVCEIVSWHNSHLSRIQITIFYLIRLLSALSLCLDSNEGKKRNEQTLLCIADFMLFMRCWLIQLQLDIVSCVPFIFQKNIHLFSIENLRCVRK